MIQCIADLIEEATSQVKDPKADLRINSRVHAATSSTSGRVCLEFYFARSVSGKNMARSVYFFRSPTKTSQSPWILRFNLVHAVRFLTLLD